jgi:hypothetical protein
MTIPFTLPDLLDNSSGEMDVQTVTEEIIGELSEWASAPWQDERVVESTVPDWIPPAMPWEQVEKKFKAKVPARAKKIRGKLNVPRERFRLTEEGEYVWAGIQT